MSIDPRNKCIVNRLIKASKSRYGVVNDSIMLQVPVQKSTDPDMRGGFSLRREFDPPRTTHRGVWRSGGNATRPPHTSVHTIPARGPRLTEDYKYPCHIHRSRCTRRSHHGVRHRGQVRAISPRKHARRAGIPAASLLEDLKRPERLPASGLRNRTKR